ncbi:MAG: PAS domain S-box protein [Rhodocyclaceae bacterium]|nr:PAS domain S-box protein [Rhodocyclaceae bacterium]
MAAIRLHAPSLALVYASSLLDLGEVLAGVREILGETTLLGATTAGEIADGIRHQTAVVVVLASPHLRVRAAVGKHVSADWEGALEEALATPALREVLESSLERARENVRRGTKQFAIILSPGNTREANSKGYQILEAFKARTLGMIPVFAGCTADDWRMEGNAVGLGDEAWEDGLLVALCETELSFGMALGHGFEPTPESFMVTAVEGDEVLALEGRPAIDVLPEGVGCEPSDLREHHVTLASGRVFGAAVPMGQYAVNAASYFTSRGGVRLTQPVPAGTRLTVMKPPAPDKVTSAAETLRKAMLRAASSSPALILCHYCALRPRLMGGENSKREMTALVSLAGGTPVAGFCSFGEGGMQDDGVSRHNNASIATLVIGSDLSEVAQIALENEGLRLEQKHQGELHFLAEALKQTEEAFLVEGPDRRIRYANPAFVRLFGYSPEEVVGRPIARISPALDPGNPAFGGAPVGVALPRVAVETVCPAKDGQNIPVLLTKSSVIGESGQVEGYVTVFTDIRQRKARERELSSAKDFAETVLSTSGAVIVVLDREGRIVRFNQAAEEITGFTFAELANQPIWDWLIPAEVQQAVKEVFDKLLHHKLAGRFENRWLLKNGGQRLFSWRNSVMTGEDGQVYYLVAVGEDITERRKMEEDLLRYRDNLEFLVEARTQELREVHQRLLDTQFAMDRAGIGIVWTDAETGQVSYTNDHMAEMFGYTPAEMLRLRISDIDRNFTPKMLAELDSQVQAAGQMTFETTGTRKDGTLVPCEVSLYHHQPNPELPARNIAFVRDISDRMRVQTALRQAKETAEAAAMAKSLFLSNMSHEIRTPMNAILGLSHLMKRGTHQYAQADRVRLDKIESSARHLLSVINDILDFSKIEAGHLELEERDFSISSVLDDVSALIGNLAEEKGLEVAVEELGMPAWLKGDATRLRQALLNYASNAVKFTRKGRIVLRARLQEERGEALLVRFEVQDTGAGINQAGLKRLFSVFQQADISTTRKYGGTGLGLAITRRLAEAMGGKAGAESEEGKGSTFWFTAWLKHGRPVRADLTAEIIADFEMLRNHAGARVLLVEDNAINREVAADLLHDTGLVLEEAENGRVALEKVRSGNYDLILMDVQMPEMNGLDATRAIRALPGWQDVPILAMTANAFASDRLVCEEAGMNDFVAKPVEPALLYGKLNKWLPLRHEDEASLSPGVSISGQNYVQGPGRVIDLLSRDGHVDLERGLSVLRGNEQKYLGFLRRLVESHGQDMVKLMAFLEHGEHKLAHNIAHNLKGVSANLSATGLARAAKALDDVVRDDSCMAEPGLLARLVSDVEQELAHLRTLLSDDGDAQPETWLARDGYS